MWVKICANTNVEDALLAAKLGADAVGFVFAPSSRQVTPMQVARITSSLPEGLERVGVFTSNNANGIEAAVREAGLTTVQLHGDLDLHLVRTLAAGFKGRVRIIQTLHWVVDAGKTSQAAIIEQLRKIELDRIVDRVLIDSKFGAATGGTGIAFDWRAARDIFQPARPGLKLLLAGGLRPENISEAIQILQPWGLDVASGVEVSAGRKDPAKLAHFIRGAKASIGPR